MQILMEVNAKEKPELIGEYLRDCFFVQDENNLGCYDSFEFKPQVEKLDQIAVKNEHDFFWNRGSLPFVVGLDKHYEQSNIEMRYWWDHDGVLVFIFPDGSALVNSDSKKIYTWEFIEDFYAGF